MGGCAGRDIANRAPLSSDPKFYVAYDGGGSWYNCSPTAEVKPRMSESGLASLPPTTLPRFLAKVAETKGDKDALLVERPVPQLVDGVPPPALPREQWTTWSWTKYHEDVRTMAKAFIVLGMQPFQSVNIWGFNSPEWVMSVTAASFAGGKCAGLYPTDTPETAAFKVVHAGGCIVVIEDRAKIDRLVKALNERGDAKRVKAVIAWSSEVAPGETLDIKGCGKVPLMTWQAALELGASKGSDAEVDARVANVEPGHAAALIYTSGTTGDPKAVMLSHDNIIFEARAVVSILRKSVGLGASEEEERVLSYLPLSHIAGLMVDIACPLATAETPGHTAAFFARPYDLKVGAIKDRLGIAKPTLFLGVPLVWEKIADRIRALGASTTGFKKTLADWAKGVALQHQMSCQLGGDGAYPTGYTIAIALLSKVKAALGLSELKIGITGAAPIRVDTLEYYGSLGININECYGMSECTGAATFSVDEVHEWGSCGFQLEGVEVKSFRVDPDDINKKTECPKAPNIQAFDDEQYQGELCFRGRNIMMGYMAQPDMGEAHCKEIEKKTKDAIDDEGWLHSGDKGMVTELGMVKITGRYKELIIGHGGENIAPVPIEDEVKRNCDGIAEVMMVGDKRKYNIAIVTLKAEGANGEVPGTDNLDAGAKRVNPKVAKISEAVDDKFWIDTVWSAIQAANNNGKVCPNAAFKIGRFTILKRNFSEETLELTPTKKLKRAVAAKVHADLIDKVYDSADNPYVHA